MMIKPNHARRAAGYLPVILLLALTAAGTSFLFHTMERKWVTFKRAELKRAAGDYIAADGLYREVVNQGLTTVDVYRGWGSALIQAQRFEDAREPLERAVNAELSDAGTVQQLAGVYQYLQQPERARELLERYKASGAALTPEVQLQLAKVYRQLKMYAEAEPLYRAVPAAHRDSRVARRELAEMLAWQQRFDESIEIFRELLALESTDTETRRVYAQVLAWAGKLEESRKQYRGVLGE